MAAKASEALETPRLVLRQFREQDLCAYTAMLSDAETSMYLGNGLPQSREDCWRSIGYMLGHWQIRGYGLYAAEERETGAMIGRIGLYRPEGWPGLEVGWLVQRDRWGQGYATEGGAAVRDHAFEALGAKRLVSVIRPSNDASIRVAEKLGETFAERIQLQGVAANIYALSRDAWAARPR